MASPVVDRDLLTDLKHEARYVAEQRGHRLSPFPNARHDPLRCVSFCTAYGGSSSSMRLRMSPSLPGACRDTPGGGLRLPPVTRR